MVFLGSNISSRLSPFKPLERNVVVELSGND